MKKNIRNFYTPREIAKLSGLSLAWIRECLQSGKLESEKLGRNYIITQNQFEQWMKFKPKKGRPRKQGNE